MKKSIILLSFFSVFFIFEANVFSNTLPANNNIVLADKETDDNEEWKPDTSWLDKQEWKNNASGGNSFSENNNYNPILNYEEQAKSDTHSGAFQIQGLQKIFENSVKEKLIQINPELEKISQTKILPVTKSNTIEAVISVQQKMQTAEESANKCISIFQLLVKSLEEEGIKLFTDITVNVKATFQFEDPRTHEILKYGEINYFPNLSGQESIKYSHSNIWDTDTTKEYQLKPLEPQTKNNDI